MPHPRDFGKENRQRREKSEHEQAFLQSVCTRSQGKRQTPLDEIDILLLGKLAFLFKTGNDCIASSEWFAHELDQPLATVKRRLVKLRDRLVIKVTRRRPTKGEFQTHVIQPGPGWEATLKRLALLIRALQPGSLSGEPGSIMSYENSSEEDKNITSSSSYCSDSHLSQVAGKDEQEQSSKPGSFLSLVIEKESEKWRSKGLEEIRIQRICEDLLDRVARKKIQHPVPYFAKALRNALEQQKASEELDKRGSSAFDTPAREEEQEQEEGENEIKASKFVRFKHHGYGGREVQGWLPPAFMSLTEYKELAAQGLARAV